MVLSDPVMENSLCVLMTFLKEINTFHIYFTACDPPWLQIWKHIERGLAPTHLGHDIGLYHPCTQHS